MLMFGRPTREQEAIYPVSLLEAKRQWKIITTLKDKGYRPRKGDEITVFPNLRPENGTHRASALCALGMPVPALIVTYKEPNNGS